MNRGTCVGGKQALVGKPFLSGFTHNVEGIWHIALVNQNTKQIVEAHAFDLVQIGQQKPLLTEIAKKFATDGSLSTDLKIPDSDDDGYNSGSEAGEPAGFPKGRAKVHRTVGRACLKAKDPNHVLMVASDPTNPARDQDTQRELSHFFGFYDLFEDPVKDQSEIAGVANRLKLNPLFIDHPDQLLPTAQYNRSLTPDEMAVGSEDNSNVRAMWDTFQSLISIEAAEGGLLEEAKL